MTKPEMIQALLSDDLATKVRDCDLQIADFKAQKVESGIGSREKCPIDFTIAKLQADRVYYWSRLMDQRVAARLMCGDEDDK